MKKHKLFLAIMACTFLVGAFGMEFLTEVNFQKGKLSKKNTAVNEKKGAKAGKKDDKKGEAKSDTLTSATFSGLKWRSIGPAFASGRIADFAVNPRNKSEWFVAVASGHIWKTVNNGTTFDPVFDNYGAYSMACVTYDPNNPSVIWVGTGENNHQRSLGYGNGVYRSKDGGKSFTFMGLKDSRQIGEVLVDPRNSDVVFVAAEGSVWGPGGDRGLFKTIDGGKNWKKVLDISENTGVNNVLIDPRNPDIMYASSEQRRRHVFTKIGGGPETAVYKSTNGGETWDKCTSGLPSVNMGGIGLAISPVNPDVIYAIIEAAENGGGFFRSSDRGASWQKMSSHTAQGQYYNEIYCDPKDVDKVYSMETVAQLTEDGGKTWRAVGNNKRHVDDHACWIDPDDTRHFLIGGDGGIYETYDAGSNFVFKSNLPVTQFYRVQVDNSKPFYYVYGGTQDNNSMGGPSRNISNGGVVSDEWFVTNGGDGFWSQIDPVDPNIVYAESQYGGMVRYDRKSQETIDIRPEPRKGEDSYKWNWNTPLILSAHSHTRLYCAANKVFRSDDRGNTWKVISDDLTDKIDRNKWPVMGKYWPSDAVAKDISTSLYGTIVSFEESPRNENLLYVGTDDGLIRITEDGGQNWSRLASFPGVPENTYVSDIVASRFDENIVFASFDNILRDDFKPYILKSSDKGKTWVSIAGNLPKNGTVHCIQQDFIDPELLFAGTEFGFFFSNDGGKIWVQLKSGMPDIQVRDIAIQKRENDLVIATFGRGFYILDDYTPLRAFKKEMLDKDGVIFPMKDALMYIPTDGKYGQGSTYYMAKNPDFGAVITYCAKEAPKSLKDLRKEKEAELFKKGEPIPQPTEAELLAEKNEIAPYLTFVITDEAGNKVRMIRKSPSAGISRINWDLRYQSNQWVEAGETPDPLGDPGTDVLAMPGKYNVELFLTVNGETRSVAGPVSFNCVVLDNTTLPAPDRSALTAFHRKVSELTRVMQGTEQYAETLFKRSKNIVQSLNTSTAATPELIKQSMGVYMQLDSILNRKFNHRSERPSDEENPPAPVPLNSRLGKISWTTWVSTSEPTQTQKDAFNILMEEFPPLYNLVKKLGESDVPALEKELERIGAPLSPGRLPDWKF